MLVTKIKLHIVGTGKFMVNATFPYSIFTILHGR